MFHVKHMCLTPCETRSNFSASRFHYLIYVIYTSLASAIFPAIADAVTVAADPRYTLELGCPARPLKLRVPVLMRTSFSPITPWQLPQHTLQFGFITMAPASIKVSIRPSFNAWR